MRPNAIASCCSALVKQPRLLPHLHLSLQSGDDLILKRMKRRHTRAEAVAFCAHLRTLRPDLVLGADLIAGFPTESEAMFARSLELVEACGLVHLHVFPYSPRPGTPAARMPQLPRAVIHERAGRLRAHGARALQRRLDQERGARRHVLVESDNCGYTEHFLPLRLAEAVKPGSLLEVRVCGHNGRRLLGSVEHSGRQC